MLKVTVSLVPGGVGRERKIGELLIGKHAGGGSPDYKVVLTADDLAEPLHGKVKQYPRWSATVWDLVSRALAVTLSGRERLPRRPQPVRKAVPICKSGQTFYVRFADIPEPARSAFAKRMEHSTRPVIPGEGWCAYSWDWHDFIDGCR